MTSKMVRMVIPDQDFVTEVPEDEVFEYELAGWQVDKPSRKRPKAEEEES